MSRKVIWKLAFKTLMQNVRIYGPFFAGSLVMTMLLYGISALIGSYESEHLDTHFYWISGLEAGRLILALFTYIFFRYINSFLNTHRSSGLSLFTALGLDKKQLVRLVFYQYLILFAGSIVTGLPLGLLFFKIMALMTARFLQGPVPYGYVYYQSAGITTILILMACYAIIFFHAARSIKKKKISELYKGQKKTEQNAKAHFILASIGFFMLLSGYILALTIPSDPENFDRYILIMFLVIVGIYMVFIFGSIAVLRLMEKNKNYYYSSSHFIHISNLKYRMKENGAALATICLLSTLIIIMLSASICLFAKKGSLVPETQISTARTRIYTAAGSLKKNLDAIEKSLDNEPQLQANLAVLQTVEGSLMPDSVVLADNEHNEVVQGIEQYNDQENDLDDDQQIDQDDDLDDDQDSMEVLVENENNLFLSAGRDWIQLITLVQKESSDTPNTLQKMLKDNSAVLFYSSSAYGVLNDQVSYKNKMIPTVDLDQNEGLHERLKNELYEELGVSGKFSLEELFWHIMPAMIISTGLSGASTDSSTVIYVNADIHPDFKNDEVSGIQISKNGNQTDSDQIDEDQNSNNQIDNNTVAATEQTVSDKIDADQAASEQEVFGQNTSEQETSIGIVIGSSLDLIEEEPLSNEAFLEQDTAEMLQKALAQADLTEEAAVDPVESTRLTLFRIRQLFSSLIFSCIFLSVSLLTIIVLVMYYKQITEGYDDRKRYLVMKKMGLDQKDIKKTISSQVLILFFLPLFVTFINIVFAYPLFNSFFKVIGIEDASGAFFGVTMICVLAFAFVYYIIYRLTARIYTSIINRP